MGAQVSAAQVAAGLAQRIDELALLILTEVRREGSELRGRGPDGGSLVGRAARPEARGILQLER